jgi:hypothetical protein
LVKGFNRAESYAIRFVKTVLTSDPSGNGRVDHSVQHPLPEVASQAEDHGIFRPITSIGPVEEQVAAGFDVGVEAEPVRESLTCQAHPIEPPLEDIG